MEAVGHVTLGESKFLCHARNAQLIYARVMFDQLLYTANRRGGCRTSPLIGAGIHLFWLPGV